MANIKDNIAAFHAAMDHIANPAIVATGLAYSQHTRGWTELVTYPARDRMEAIRWIAFNRDWMKDLRIDGKPV